MNELYFFNLNCCPGCKSKDSNIIYTCNYLESPIRDYLDSFYGSQGKINFEYLKGSAYILKECGECGLIYQDQIPNDLLMKKIYNEWIDPKLSLNGLFKKKEWNFKQYSSYAQEIMILIDYFKKIKRPLNFFDFGMGWGRWCLMAKAFGCNVYGTELSISKIKYAKSIGINVINWDEIPNFKFDFINTEQIFEHISNPLETELPIHK